MLFALALTPPMPPEHEHVTESTEADQHRFLAWLDYDHERAEEACEKTLRRLVRFFRSWYLSSAEDLASETLLRTAKKFAGGKYLDGRVAASYIREVAKRVRWEAYSAEKRQQVVEIDDQIASPSPSIEEVLGRQSDLHDLEWGLTQLKADHKDFILRYYRADAAKERVDLAAELGIEPNAMRVRANYIRGLLLEILKRRRK